MSSVSVSQADELDERALKFRLKPLFNFFGQFSGTSSRRTRTLNDDLQERSPLVPANVDKAQMGTRSPTHGIDGVSAGERAFLF